jgi:hypothetical protein
VTGKIAFTGPCAERRGLASAAGYRGGPCSAKVAKPEPYPSWETALRPQILVFTYHKTGTVLFEHVMRAAAARFGLSVSLH